MSNATLAGTLRMGPGEKLNVSISFANRLATGETLTGSATTTLTDQEESRTYTTGLSGSPSVATPAVIQTVQSLVSGHSYLLDILIGTSASQTLEGQVLIFCEGSPHLI